MKEREKRESVRNGEKERKMKRNDRREKREREKRKRMKARNQDRERRDKTKYDRTCVGTYPRYHSTIYHSLSVFSGRRSLRYREREREKKRERENERKQEIKRKTGEILCTTKYDRT